MARIQHYDRFPFDLTQHDSDFGCIPTNIAAVLNCYVGQAWATEEWVTKGYLGTICFETLTGIQPPAKLLTKLSVRRGHREWPLSDFFELHLVNLGDRPFEEWWRQVTTWINNNGWPVLFSYTRSDGSIHVCTAVGVEGDTLETYDPSPVEQRRAIPMAKSDLDSWWLPERPHLNHDIMAIEFKQAIWN